jgi:hypothetical protein
LHGKPDRRREQQCNDRMDVELGDEQQRTERRRDQKLAVRQIHDARDAVLQRQPHRHQRVHAAEGEAGEEDVEQDHELKLSFRRTPACAGTGSARRNLKRRTQATV